MSGACPRGTWSLMGMTRVATSEMSITEEENTGYETGCSGEDLVRALREGWDLFWCRGV